MITLNDVLRVDVDDKCERFPCRHENTVHLRDGRKAHCFGAFEICSVISQLADEKINPGCKWSGAEVKKHFATFNVSMPQMGYFDEPPEDVLAKVFSRKLRG